MSKQTAQTPRTQSISLLWQQQKLEEMGELAPRINEDCIRDLELVSVIRELIPVNDFRFKSIKAIFANLCTDAEVLNYRQEVLKDLLNNPHFVTGLQEVAPHISSLNYRPHGSEKDDSGLFEVAWRLGQTDLFATAIQKLCVLFMKSSNLCDPKH